MEAATTWWSSVSFWRKTASWVTAGSFVILIFLTFDSLSQISAGSKRVPAYSVINHRISYVLDAKRNFQVPVIGPEEPGGDFPEPRSGESLLRSTVCGYSK